MLHYQCFASVSGDKEICINFTSCSERVLFPFRRWDADCRRESYCADNQVKLRKNIE